jgi:NAD(P)H-nitrite reductase large subunit
VEQRITCVQDHITGIAVEQQYIQLQSGRQLAYDRLLLASGARPNTLTCPGSNLAGVTTLRSVADYQNVLNRLDTARHIVVVGSGTLALESVESLRQRGYAVSHLLRRNILWSEVLDATASDLVLQQEMRDGADVYLEEEIVEITSEQGRVSGVVTTKGKRIACDMVIIAIGIAPNIDFIQRSGIACGRGVQVDAMMRTNAPHIYAAGDVVETSDSTTGRTRVIGQWYPAIQQARAAAYSMLEVLDTNHPFQTTTFYNATFLYGLDFASVGITNIVDSRVQTIVADPQPRTYRKATLANGVPIGMLSLGNRAGTLAFKRAIDYRVNLSSVASVLFAEHFKLHDWLNSQGVPPPMLGVNRIGEYAESVL